MEIEILGPQPFERDAQGALKSRVGTVFLHGRALVTLPGIHASQRAAYVEHLNRQRATAGLPALTPTEEAREWDNSADLFFEADTLLIRPDPAHMDLAFEADQLLQELVSKRRIKFMFVVHEEVQRAIKERGECWRISSLPRSRDGMRRLVEESKVAIGQRPIYYYNRVSGTRHLTFDEFARLEPLAAPDLARQLQEVADHARTRNRLGNPEVDFFAADSLSFGARDFAGVRFTELPEVALRARYHELKSHFQAAVDPPFRTDDPRSEAWRNRMFSALVSQRDETLAEEILRGLSPEFFLQIEWLPGGRFEEGEFIFDPIFEEADQRPNDTELQNLCDRKARDFIFNFIREYGDLEYVNVGRVAESLSVRPDVTGRRGVYLAELKVRATPTPMVRFIRMQKWGIRERLNEGKGLLPAMLESDEYTDYVLDRRLGCRQLGMNVPPRVTVRRVGEVYTGANAAFRGQLIRSPYMERDYIPGIATDKLPSWKYAREGYALRVAQLLGKAAAANVLVGRTWEDGAKVVFDDGDEVVVEGADGLPQEMIVGDHSGAFGEYQRPLLEYAKDYAKPVNSRLTLVPRPRAFAEAYLAAFLDQFLRVQGDYRKRRRAFDSLFKHRPYDRAGSFAFRWECVLRRLDQTEAGALADAIRKHITVLTGVAG